MESRTFNISDIADGPPSENSLAEALTHSQGPHECVDPDIEVLWVKLGRYCSRKLAV